MIVIGPVIVIDPVIGVDHVHVNDHVHGTDHDVVMRVYVGRRTFGTSRSRTVLRPSLPAMRIASSQTART